MRSLRDVNPPPRSQENRLLQLAYSDAMDKARKGVLSFTKWTWPQYQVNWHHLAICRFLNRFIKGEFKRGMIFCPPRHGKSELVSRRLPALLHGIYPDAEIMFATYSESLAADMTIDTQRIMDRPEYHALFPRSRITPEGSVSRYPRQSLQHKLIPIEMPDGTIYHPKGAYRAAGVSGAFTGKGANFILIDDICKNREEADSITFRNKAWKFYTSTLYSRLEKNAGILLTQTRWHEDELPGRLLKLAKSDPEADQWEVLSLPAIKDNMDDPHDPRMLGEPLWPDKYDIKALTRIRKNSSRDWAALYQQRPTVEGGNIIKFDWFKYYNVLPQRFEQVIDSWDFAVKDKSGSDYTVGTKWGRIGANKYLISMIRGRFSFPVACQKVVELKASNAQTNKVLIEAKANGPAVKQTLAAHVSGLVEVEPRGDKLSRTNAISPEFESGNVWFPSTDIAPWLDDVASELTGFPFAVNDDIVDSVSMALDALRKATALYIPRSGHGMQ